MADLRDYEDDLLRQSLHLQAAYEALWQARSHAQPPHERDRSLIYCIERFGEYRDLVERMLRDLDRTSEADESP